METKQLRFKLLAERMDKKRSKIQSDAAIKRGSGNHLTRFKKSVIDSDGNKFTSLTEAGEFWGISKQAVCKVLKGLSKRTRRGISFKYES